MDADNQVAITKTSKSKANAIIGIHRHSGYASGFTYTTYALLLDTLGISLILFTLTGVIMWFHLLKKDKWAWIIFFAGLAYFTSILLYLTLS